MYFSIESKMLFENKQINSNKTFLGVPLHNSRFQALSGDAQT